MQRPFRHFVASVVLAGLAMACGSASPRGDHFLPPGADDTKLGSGDAFEVRVYGEKELSGGYRVTSEGTIDFPFIGRLEIAGKEPNEVADLIASHLIEKQILRDPQVSVLVTDQASKRVSVVGAVNKPGTFPMASGMTVVQAVGLAGGFTSLASRNQTLVTRRVDGKTERIVVAVEKVTEGREDDFILQAGDVVYVPERLF